MHLLAHISSDLQIEMRYAAADYERQSIQQCSCILIYYLLSFN